MRNQAKPFLICALQTITIMLALLASTIASAQSRMSDPFFAIEYDPGKIHFEEMPSLLKQTCKELHDYYAKAWVYGHLKSYNVEYFILYGYIKVPSENQPGVFSIQREEDDGLIVALENSQCVVDQVPSVLFRQKDAKILVPSNLLHEITAEVLERYAKAFRGKNEFLKRVTPQARASLPPIMQSQLQKFESSR